MEWTHSIEPVSNVLSVVSKHSHGQHRDKTVHIVVRFVLFMLHIIYHRHDIGMLHEPWVTVRLTTAVNHSKHLSITADTTVSGLQLLSITANTCQSQQTQLSVAYNCCQSQQTPVNHSRHNCQWHWLCSGAESTSSSNAWMNDGIENSVYKTGQEDLIDGTAEWPVLRWPCYFSPVWVDNTDVICVAESGIHCQHCLYT